VQISPVIHHISKAFYGKRLDLLNFNIPVSISSFGIEQFYGHVNLGFEIVTGTQAVTSKCSSGSDNDNEGLNEDIL
jgi:hypothetical protein